MFNGADCKNQTFVTTESPKIGNIIITSISRFGLFFSHHQERNDDFITYILWKIYTVCTGNGRFFYDVVYVTSWTFKSIRPPFCFESAV